MALHNHPVPASALPTHLEVDCDCPDDATHCEQCGLTRKVDAACDGNHHPALFVHAVIYDGQEYFCAECAADRELIASVSHLTVPSLEACRVSGLVL